jgi:hypothetical protein
LLVVVIAGLLVSGIVVWISAICSFAGLPQTNTMLVLVQGSSRLCGMLPYINFWYNYCCGFATVAKFLVLLPVEVSGIIVLDLLLYAVL